MPLRLRLAHIALAIFLSLTFQHAKADWPPIAPAEMAMTSVAEYPGAPAVVLLHEEIDDDLQHYHSVYMRIKILTEAGRKYADVEIPYNRQMWKIGEVSGRTVHADGSIVPFEGKAFDKVILKGHGIRYYVKSFTLPDVQPGSIVEYRYVHRYGDRTAIPPRWIVQSDLLQKKVSFKFTPYEKDLILEHERIGHGVAWTSFMPKDKQPQYKETVKARWVELQAENVPPLIEEPFMPPPTC